MMDSAEIIKKYNTVVQHKVILSDTQNLIGEVGRGSGKTTEMFAPRIVRISYDMPRSTMILAGPTYVFIMDTLIPGIVTYLAEHYQRGWHYEYGKEPPKFFLQPYTPVGNWKHTITFAWGTVILWGSLDRPESMIGKNVVHLLVDEMLRIEEIDFTERVFPALRGNREIFGKSHYFGGITAFSSTPNFENDHDWWLEWEKNVNPEAIKVIEYVAYRTLKAEGELVNAEIELEEARKENKTSKIESIENEIARLTRFINRWHIFLNEKRCEDNGKWTYIKGSSFSNLPILSIDYMKRQFAGTKHNPSKFLLSILGIRPERVKEMFFSFFSKQHIYTDSYKYEKGPGGFDDTSKIGEYKRTSADLKYCNPEKPLLMGYDPGNFMSCVFAQERGNDLRVFKNSYCWTPKQHFDMAAQIDEFFRPHTRKYIKLWYDRAGNQRKSIYANNPKGKTDIAILKRCLEDLGWRIELMTPPDQRTIEYWEHKLLLDTLLSEREKKTPHIRICQYECEELISSIYMSPLKREKGNWIELDKSSEVKLDYEDQPWYSTQIPSSLMYLIFGLYEKYKPAGMKENFDIPGL
jgi:hypothetical protein